MYKNTQIGDTFEDYDVAHENMYETMSAEKFATKFFEIVSPRAGKFFQFCKFLEAGKYLIYFKIYVIIKWEI